jgi:hypothetical protein
MSAVQPCAVPPESLLAAYAGDGGYADCYAADLGFAVTQADYVAAFYTTRAFKLERLILKFAVSRPSTDAQARQLAQGDVDSFAAWTVEGRRENELLLCDLHGRTRSWLMTAAHANEAGTRLCFGSAVVPLRDRKTGTRRMGAGFNALLGFHRLYSRILLAAARSRLQLLRSSSKGTSSGASPKGTSSGA